jgi:hypothetical protein
MAFFAKKSVHDRTSSTQKHCRCMSLLACPISHMKELRAGFDSLVTPSSILAHTPDRWLPRSADPRTSALEAFANPSAWDSLKSTPRQFSVLPSASRGVPTSPASTHERAACAAPSIPGLLERHNRRRLLLGFGPAHLPAGRPCKMVTPALWRVPCRSSTHIEHPPCMPEKPEAQEVQQNLFAQYPYASQGKSSGRRCSHLVCLGCCPHTMCPLCRLAICAETQDAVCKMPGTRRKMNSGGCMS